MTVQENSQSFNMNGYPRLDSISGCTALLQVVADLQLSRLAASAEQAEGRHPGGKGSGSGSGRAGSPFTVPSAKRSGMASTNPDEAEKLLPRTDSH